MLQLKQAWTLLLKLHEYSLVFATNWLHVKLLPDALKETTMKQRMTSINDYIIVCLFQNYKNMWNKRTDAKEKRLSKMVSSKNYYSQVHFDNS